MRVGIVVACLLLAPACDRVFQLEDPDHDAAIDEPAGQCGASYQGKRFLIEMVQVTWLTAELRCESLDERADDGWHSHLTVVTDRIEAAQIGLPAGSEAWAGMVSVDFSPVFRWITDEDTPPAPWAEGKPSSGAEDRCATIEEANLSLDDTSCAAGDVTAYVCECDRDPAVPAAYAGL